VCAGGECRTTCSSSAACGASGACSAGSCVQPVSGVDAGAPMDAASRDAPVSLGDGGRAVSGTGSPCGAGGTCASGLDCATAAENGSVPVCRRPCSVDVDCAGEGLGSYCYAMHCTTSCDPIANTGCGGEVCGTYTGNPSEGMVDYTDCHTAGALGLDQGPCMEELDCAAGTTCMFGTCRRTCDRGAPPPAGCEAGFACFPLGATVNDPTHQYGACCPDPMGC